MTSKSKNTILNELKEMRAMMERLTKRDDEAAAYNMIDRGDSFDAVREKLRAGYEVSHLDTSKDVFEKLAKKIINNEPTTASIFDGLPVQVNTDLPAGTLRAVFKKSTPRNPIAPDDKPHADYTPDIQLNTHYTPDHLASPVCTHIAHSIISIDAMPCI